MIFTSGEEKNDPYMLDLSSEIQQGDHESIITVAVFGNANVIEKKRWEEDSKNMEEEKQKER